MKRLLFIFLCLSLALNAHGQQALFFENNYTAPAGGGGSCSNTAALAYIAEETTQGKTFTAPQQAAICAWYTNLAAAGIYSKIKAGGILKLGSANANKVNLVNPTTYSSNTGSPTIGGTGMTYNGTTQHTNAGVTMDITASINSAGFGVWVVTAAATDGTVYAGAGDASNTLTGIRRGVGTGSVQWGVNKNGFSTATSSNTGFLYATRTGSATSTLYLNGSSVATSVTSSVATTPPNVFIGAFNDNGSPIQYSNSTISFWIITDGLTGTEAATLYSETNTLLSAL